MAEEKEKISRPGAGIEHVPTASTKKFVLECVRARIRHVDIAEQLGISEVTLRKHYREEISMGRTQVAHRAAEIIFQFLHKDSDSLHPEDRKQQRDVALKVLNSHGWSQQVEVTGEVNLPEIVVKRAPDHPEDK